MRGSAGEVGAGDFEGAEVAEQGEGEGFGDEELVGEALQVGGGDAVDFGGDLVEGEELAPVHLLAGEGGHAGVGGLEAEDHVAFELVFGALELVGSDGFGLEAGELLEGAGEDLAGVGGGAAGVDGEGAGVAEGVELGVDGVGEAAVFPDGLEEAGGHAAAEDGVEDVGGVAVGGSYGEGWDCEAELHLLEGLLVLEGDVGEGGGGVGVSEAGGGTGGERAEGGGDLGDEVVVLDVAGGGEDHVGRGEAAGVLGEDDLLVEAGDGFGGAEDGAAEGVALPEVLGEELVDEVVGVVFVHFDFFEDDALFFGDVVGGEGGVEDEVGEEVEGGGDVFVEDLDVEADGFFAGEGVEVATDGVDFAGELRGGSGGGAFEDHVFDEVRDAVGGEGLVA